MYMFFIYLVLLHCHSFKFGLAAICISVNTEFVKKLGKNKQVKGKRFTLIRSIKGFYFVNQIRPEVTNKPAA